MILINKENVQLSIEERELEKYLSMGFIKYEPKKVETKKVEADEKTIKKSFKKED